MRTPGFARAEPISAVILAGGEAKRFPGKLWARGLHGRGLLEHIVGESLLVAREVIVALRGLDPRGEPPRHPRVRIVFDEPLAHRGCSGPLAGILTGALMASHERLIVASGDYGYLTVAPLRILAGAAGFESASLYWCNGVVETLLYSTTRSLLLWRVVRACREWGLAPRPSLALRLARSLLLVPISLTAMDPARLTSVNRAALLVSPKPRGEPACRAASLSLEPPLSRLGGAPTPRELVEEARYWLERGIHLLALHAARDAARLGGDASDVERLALERMGLGALHT